MERNSARFETVWSQNGHSASLANAQIRRREFANMLAETKLRAESETSICPLMSSAIVIFETPTRSCPGAWCKSVALYAAPGG